MTEPKRWLDQPSELSTSEHRALLAARRHRPSSTDKRAVWAALSASLPLNAASAAQAVAGQVAEKATHAAASGAPATSAAPAAACGAATAGNTVAGAAAGAAQTAAGAAIGTAGPLLIAKSMLVGMAVAAGTVGSAWLVTEGGSAKEQPAQLVPVVPVQAAKSAREVLPTTTGTPELRSRELERSPQAPSTSPLASSPSVRVGHRAERGASSGSPPASAPSADQRPTAPEPQGLSAIAEESRRLAEARRLLNAGELAAALLQLRGLEAAYPGGLLSEEREVLILEALFRSGQREAARVRAAQFITRYPRSPHLAAVQTFLR